MIDKDLGGVLLAFLRVKWFKRVQSSLTRVEGFG